MFKKIYIVTIMDSDGFVTGGEVRCIVSTHKDSLFEYAYSKYEDIYEESVCHINTDNKKKSYEEFCHDLECGFAVYIWCDTYHISFDIHEKYVYINDENEMEN